MCKDIGQAVDSLKQEELAHYTVVFMFTYFLLQEHHTHIHGHWYGHWPDQFWQIHVSSYKSLRREPQD